MIIWRSFNINIYLFIYQSIDLSIDLFIYLSFYQSIYLIHNIGPISLCSACHLIKLPPVNLSPCRGVFLTLHYHMHFINNRNEEIQAKILEFSADRMQQPLHVLILSMWQFYCHSYFALISLRYMVIGLWTFSWMEPMCAAELTWYTLKVYSWILMKHTWWNWHAVPGTAYWNIGHTAGTLRKIGIYFILRKNWRIDVLWNISNMFYWICFFSVQHMVSILNCIFCIDRV